MSTTICKGAILALLRADATGTGGLATLGVTPASVHADVNPPDAVLPLIVVKQIRDRAVWQNEKSRKVEQRFRAVVRAVAATVPGARNPSEQIADRIEALLNWQSLNLPQTRPLKFLRDTRAAEEESRVGPTGERVFRVTLEWAIDYELTSVGVTVPTPVIPQTGD